MNILTKYWLKNKNQISSNLGVSIFIVRFLLTNKSLLFESLDSEVDKQYETWFEQEWIEVLNKWPVEFFTDML